MLAEHPGRHNKVGDQDDDDKNGADADPDPAVIVVVHDFLHALADQGQAEERGEDEEDHEEGGVGRVVHKLIFNIVFRSLSLAALHDKAFADQVTEVAQHRIFGDLGEEIAGVRHTYRPMFL